MSTILVIKSGILDFHANSRGWLKRSKALQGMQMEWGFILGLGAITLVVIGLVIYFGQMLSRAVEKHAPESDFSLNVTPTGNALFACMVAFWIYCAATRVLDPESPLGIFLGDVDGVAAVMVGSTLFAGIAGVILERLGYPIARRGGRGG